MDNGTPGDRLRLIRTKRYETAKEAASAYGWGASAYTHHENGTRPIKPDVAERYARAFGVSPAWLLFGGVNERAQVPLVGRVGAGGEVMANDPAYDVDYVDLPPGGTPDLEALEVVNGSMLPVYRAGDLLFVRGGDTGPPMEQLVGVECVVECEDGRRLVKVLRRGTAPGLWRLDSYNAEPIEDVRVVRAAPVTNVTKAWARKRA